MTYKIMLVDDEPANLRLLERLFRRDYHVLTASSGDMALQLLAQHDVALLITDQRMAGMTGIELLERTAAMRPHTVRIILTGYTDVEDLVQAINSGHVYKYVTKPWSNDELRMTVSRALEHYETNRSRHELERANERLSTSLKEMSRGVVRAIIDALEAKDEHLHGHARRSSGYAVAIGRRMRLDVAQLEEISLAALLHDIGKIGTPDRILLKPGVCTEEELAVIRLHSERGARMLAGMPDMQDVASAVRHHHENWDGTGYPEGLSGEQIPLSARVILVAEAYDAMTSPRPFREAFDHESAVERLQRGAGTHFDPQVVRAFCGLEEITQIRGSIAEQSWGQRLSPAPVEADNLSFAEMVREVEREPVLAACVVQRANRECARDAGSNVAPLVGILAACERIGVDALRALVAENVARARCTISPDELWEHTLRSAAAARLLAEQTGVMDADDAYALALLHDTGELLLRSLFPETMENILWFKEERLDREVAAFGVDHAQVSQWVLDACGVPRQLTSAVQAHHDAARINDPVALLLNLADSIAHAKDSSEIATLDNFGTDRLYILRLSRGDLARIHQLTTEALEETHALATV